MIWYVEDDASIRDIAIYALNSAGFETKSFEEGLSFWEALKKEKPEHLEVILTGQQPSDELVELADYVSEIRKIKHPFDQGLPARPGIEK